MLTSPAAEIFRSSLLPHERVLWTGQPKQGLVLSALDTFLIPFSLLWGGFAIFWNIGVWTFPETQEGVDWFFRLFGLPFLVVGLYLIFGRFIHDASIRRHIAYAVTDQRVLVSRKSAFSSKITSLDLHRLPRLDLTEFRDDTGTISFEADGFNFFAVSSGMTWWLPSLANGTQFFRIPDPRAVYDLIRKQAAN